MAEQKLDRPQIPGTAIDQLRFGPAQRVSAVQMRIKPDACQPLGQKPCVSSRCHTLTSPPAAEQKFTGFSAGGSDVVVNGQPGCFCKLKTNGRPVFF